MILDPDQQGYFPLPGGVFLFPDFVTAGGVEEEALDDADSVTGRPYDMTDIQIRGSVN